MSTSIIPSVKRCTKCGEDKPFEAFSRSKASKDRLFWWCKACARTNRQQKQANPNIAIAGEWKRCTGCGEEKPATNEYFSRQAMGKCGFNAQCKRCISLYQQGRKAELRAYQSEWRKKNPEKGREGVKRWRERHPEAAHEADVKRYRSNPEKERARVRDYRARNPDKAKFQYKAYRATAHGRAVINLHAQKYRAKKMAVLYDLTKQEWEFCLSHFDGACAVCGQRSGFWATIVQDHWIPVAKGGATTMSNIIPLCHAKKDGSNCCNNTKSARNADEWLVDRVGTKKAAQVTRRIKEYFDIVAQRK